jgi:transposase-like protein
MHSRDNSIPQNHHSRRRRVTAGGDAEARPRLASANRGPLPSLAWADVERITHGQLGRTISTVCPFCSHTRRTANQRKAVFAIKLKAPDFAIYNCAHCGESGYVHSERSSRVVDLGKRQRQRVTAYALQLWNERQAFRGSPAETYLRETRRIGSSLSILRTSDATMQGKRSSPNGHAE